MRKLREAAVVAAVVGSVSMIGAGATAACPKEEAPTPPVSITCEQDTGDNTLTDQEATATDTAVNVSNALNGGDADSSANQQLCGLENEDAENTAAESEGGDGGTIGAITL